MEYELDAEGTFSMDSTKPYKCHVHIVELLGSSEEGMQKLVQVSDVVSAPWVMGLWRNTLTRSEFLDGVCVDRKMENYVNYVTGEVLHRLPLALITRGLGKYWIEDSGTSPARPWRPSTG